MPIISDLWEYQIIDIPLTKLNKHVILLNIYKPPKDNTNVNIETFISELSIVLQELSRFNANIIITGDFNNLLEINDRRIFSSFYDLMTTNSFYPQITLPTRFTDNSCSLIDNIFYKCPNRNHCMTAGIILTEISDSSRELGVSVQAR